MFNCILVLLHPSATSPHVTTIGYHFDQIKRDICQTRLAIIFNWTCPLSILVLVPETQFSHGACRFFVVSPRVWIRGWSWFLTTLVLLWALQPFKLRPLGEITFRFLSPETEFWRHFLFLAFLRLFHCPSPSFCRLSSWLSLLFWPASEFYSLVSSHSPTSSSALLFFSFFSVSHVPLVSSVLKEQAAPIRGWLSVYLCHPQCSLPSM